MQSVLLQMNHITKYFDGVAVLNDLSFCAQKGEIHGLVGGNAAGKSTLAEILAGAEQPDGGEILIEGTPVKIGSRPAAEALGISMSFHEIELFPDLTVYENIVAGRERALSGNRVFIPKKAWLVEKAKALMDELGLTLDPYQKARGLSEGERLLIQLARTAIGNPRIIVLDEATSLLTSIESQAVFRLLDRLRSEGKCILFISHRVDDILQHCDRVSVLSDGKIAETYSVEAARKLPFSNIMAGRTVEFRYPKLPVEPGEPLLSVQHVSTGILQDISFTLHRGEILGIAGLVGSGRTTLMRAISGARKLDAGSIELCGGAASGQFGIVPDNYDLTALFGKLNIARNITMSNLKKVAKEFLVSHGRERLYARDMVDRLGIADADIAGLPESLSAGNRQKVVIARSVFSNSDVFLFDEPTQNLGSVCKLEMYNIFNALAKKGAAIILISSDFSELLGMCGRIIMLKGGRQVGTALSGEVDSEYLYAHTRG